MIALHAEDPTVKGHATNEDLLPDFNRHLSIISALWREVGDGDMTLLLWRIQTRGWRPFHRHRYRDRWTSR
jgi:hypothetical protein